MGNLTSLLGKEELGTVLPNAQCPIPNAQSPMPNPQSPINPKLL
ncbi:hypothetical protein [Nostoc sp.]